jgi:hypothetical protein
MHHGGLDHALVELAKIRVADQR